MVKYARMGPDFLKQQTIRVTNAASYRRGLPDGAPRYETVYWTEAYQPIMPNDGHWVVPCDGTVDSTFGGELLDTTSGGGLTRISTFFASVFAQDKDGREALNSYLDKDLVQIVLH